MGALYRDDLAFIHATAYGELASRAAPAIIERLRAAAIPIRRVLDVGVGAGITTAAFVAAGFEVCAVEPSPALAVIAGARAPQARILCASIDDIEIPPCEAIVAVGEPLSYYPAEVDAAERLRTRFAAFARALPAGGLLVFDIIARGDPPLDGRGFRSDPDWVVLVETIEHRAEGRLVRSIETFRRDGAHYRRDSEVHHVAVFDERDVATWLGEAGFAVEVTSAYGDAPLLPRRRAFFATRRA